MNSTRNPEAELADRVAALMGTTLTEADVHRFLLDAADILGTESFAVYGPELFFRWARGDRYVEITSGPSSSDKGHSLYVKSFDRERAIDIDECLTFENCELCEFPYVWTAELGKTGFNTFGPGTHYAVTWEMFDQTIAVILHALPDNLALIPPQWRRPLTLRWDGLGGFTLIGAAERYRQPAAGLWRNGQFPATFKTRFGDSDEYPTPFNVHFGKSDESIPRYNGPSGSATHPITPGNSCYDITVKKVQTGRAYIHYAAMSENPAYEPSYAYAWVDCSSLYVLLHSRHESVAVTLFAEPTRTSRPLQTIKNEYVDDSQIRPFPWQLLEAREGWLKVRHLRTHVTGWVESRFATDDFVQ